MTRKQRQPDNRRRKTKKQPGLAARLFDSAGRLIARHPSVAGGSAVFVVVFAFVSANAIWYQPGGHPSPIYSTRVSFTPPPAAVRRQAAPVRETAERPEQSPVAEPAEYAELPTEAQPEPEPQTIEDILAPVPARRVASVSFRPEDNTATASIPPRPDEPASRSVQENDQRALLRAVQRELARLDYYEGEIDGLAGPKTEAALRAYGERAGLPDVPRPSEGLLARLRIAERGSIVTPRARPQSAAGAQQRPAQMPVTRVGFETEYVPPLGIPEATSASPELVRKIQQGLVNIAYSDVAIDGVMGNQTRDAIRRFQQHYRLPLTGQPSETVLMKLEEIGAL